MNNYLKIKNEVNLTLDLIKLCQEYIAGDPQSIEAMQARQELVTLNQDLVRLVCHDA